jgi:hypothetical protein
MSNLILFITLIAIVFYTIETRRLRKWQQKSVQIAIFDLRQRILMHGDEMRSKNVSSDLNIQNKETINMMNDILEYGEFDFKKLYANGIIKENPKKNFLAKWFD